MTFLRKAVPILMTFALSSFLMVPAGAATESEQYIFEKTPEYTHEEIVELIANSPDSVSYSELDMLKQKQAEARRIINSSKATLSEKISASMILSEDLCDEVYELQKVSDNELRERGIGEDRIQIIRNFKGTDEELQALSATCTVTKGTVKQTTNASGRWVKLPTYFQWNRIPFWHKNYDAMIAGANSTFLFQRVPDCTCTVNYRTDDNASASTGTKRSFTKNNFVINPFSEGLIGGCPYPAQLRFTDAQGESRVGYPISGSAVFVFMSVDGRQVALSFGNAHATREVTSNIGIDFTTGGLSSGAGFGLSEYGYDVEAKALDPIRF